MHPIERPLRAAFEEGDFQFGKFLEYSSEHQGNQSWSAVHDAAEYVGLEEVIETIGQFAVAVGMTEQRDIQFFRSLVVRIEAGMIQVAVADVRNQMAGFEP
jgi:hypothetical protein